MATGGLDVPQSPPAPAHGTLLGRCAEPNVEEPSADIAVDGVGRLRIHGGTSSSDGEGSSEIKGSNNEDGDVQVTCFTEILDDVTLHFQIIRLHKQIYAWIGCNSAKFGHLYAAASTQPNNTVSVTNILGGASDNTGSGIARRLVLKTGLNVILACDIPKNSPMLEADAEKNLVQKLINLGYTRPKSNGSSS